jgi:hypothetical protein
MTFAQLLVICGAALPGLIGSMPVRLDLDDPGGQPGPGVAGSFCVLIALVMQ